MGREEGELPNPSTGDSSRQRSGGEALKGKGPHKQLGGTITGSSLLLLLRCMQQWSEAQWQDGCSSFYPSLVFVFAPFHS